MTPRGDLRVRADLINPLPKQAQFLDLMWKKQYLLYGGAAGGGKSRILRWSAIELLTTWAAKYGVTGAMVGLFCESYPLLEDRQISKISREFPEWLGRLARTQEDGLCFFLHPSFGGGRIALRNLDKPEKYASAEFGAVLVDELTKNPRQTFDDLRFRMRWPGVPHSPFLAATNPGSIGHAWVRKLWIDRDFSGDDSELDPDSFQFIPAQAHDNPYLPPGYIKLLQSLPPDMRAAMLDGSWDVFEGQAFSEWRRDLHVVEPFIIPDHWERWTGTDYGYAAPFCCLWFAKDPETQRIYVYREVYRTGVTASGQAIGIRRLSANENIRAHVADPSMWAKRMEGRGMPLASEYAREGIHLLKANNDRLTGLDYVRRALAWKRLPPTADGEPGRLMKAPRLQVFSTCKNLIRTLPALPYDEHQVEDVDTDAEDHAYDALRYGLAWEQQTNRGGETIYSGVKL